MEPLNLNTKSNETLHIWTDGSYFPSSGRMGTATIIQTSSEERYIETHRIKGSPSSTRPEEIAIMVGIIRSPPSKNLHFHVDSKAGINVITRIISEEGIPDHQLMTLPNYTILEQIKFIQEKRTGLVTFEWIHSHAGLDPNNDLADELAKLACLKTDITEIPIVNEFHLYTKNQLIEYDPSQLIKDLHKEQIRQRFHNELNTKFQKQICTPLVIKLLNRGKISGSMNEFPFRLKSLLGTLPTNEI